MPLIFCLVDILTFVPYSTVKTSVVLYLHCRSYHAPPSCDGDGHLQAVRPKVGYGSLVKFFPVAK